VHTEEEAPLDAALREFEEEIGAPPPPLEYELLGTYRQSSGKVVTVYIGEPREPVAFVASNTFELEWPRGSGVVRAYPEIETARWLPLAEAAHEIVAGQAPALEDLVARLHH
jgi:predicted NUDIX family NTP pyrophosphohydrolase